MPDWWMIVRPICTKIFAKNPFRFCRVSTTLWEAFRWTSGTALRCGICTLPVNAALSTMAQNRLGGKFSSGCDLWRTDCCGNCLPGNSQFPQYALCRRIPFCPELFPGRSNADESYPAERTRCRAGCTDIGSGHSGNPQTVWHPSASGLCHAGKCPRPKKKAGVRTGGQIIPNATMPFTAKPPWHTGTGSISSISFESIPERRHDL